ncbi:MAG: hypothetical protein ACOC71_04730 [Hyphomicrobiales bacterium]
MNKSLLTLTASAFLLATTLGTAQAQSTGDDDAMQQQRAEQGQHRDRMKHHDDRKKKKYGKHRDRRSGMRHHRMGRHGMGRGMMGRGMMGQGMDGGMGHRGMMQVVFAIMDANGDGSLSLEEVQEAHARIFAHMDANDDDQVTKEEIRAFFHGGKDRRRMGRRDRSETMQDNDDMDDTDLNLSDDVDEDDDN